MVDYIIAEVERELQKHVNIRANCILIFWMCNDLCKSQKVALTTMPDGLIDKTRKLCQLLHGFAWAAITMAGEAKLWELGPSFDTLASLCS